MHRRGSVFRKPCHHEWCSCRAARARVIEIKIVKWRQKWPMHYILNWPARPGLLGFLRNTKITKPRCTTKLAPLRRNIVVGGRASWSTCTNSRRSVGSMSVFPRGGTTLDNSACTSRSKIRTGHCQRLNWYDIRSCRLRS